VKNLNLLWGSPRYLAPYWSNIKLNIKHKDRFSYIYGILPSLEESIRKLHKQEKNAIVEDKYIVVGNGASQILQALFHVLGKNIWCNSPYFSRFPLLAAQAGVSWSIDQYDGYQIITSPNNPDGSVSWSEHPNKIFDLSYNWKQYTDPIEYNQDIMVFTISKATGFASTRIGWCVVSDPKLAKDLTQYIEINSGGVCGEAQEKAVAIIKSQLNNKNTCFDYGSKVLLSRWNQLKKIKTKLHILNSSGHFIWFKKKNMSKYFKDRNISYLSGDHFGEDIEHGRLNLGCSASEFKELLRRISESYNEFL